ncbi:MAG: type III pantothenate kinase [Bacteroidales bacterium]|nr:type III pantothenate kinase [Bacteroidales bacterium]MCF8454591.1 type III pantothenate kinase [Bacteroidales bacterium]
MNLLIDIGNSFTKLGVFDLYKKIHLSKYTSLCEADLLEILKSFPNLKAAIVSASGNTPGFLIPLLKERIPFVVELNHRLPLPLIIEYATPETLGKDRIAVVVGAQYLFPNSSVLVIDVGTAITYEFLSAEGVYKGGNISPGLEMRFRALNHFTDKLPLLSPKAEHPFMGDSTENAITSGVQSGIQFEMEGYIKDMVAKYPGLKVVLTGGDSFFFAGKLKSTIFAEVDLLFYGLNKILEYNILKNTNE